MHRVYSSPSEPSAHLVRNVLANHGIPCLVRNEYSTKGYGPNPSAGWVEVWIINGDDLAEAQRIIESEVEEQAAPEAPWRCAGCGEEMEGQFTQCWNCGTERLQPQV